MPTRKLLLADDSVTTQRVIELTFSHEDMQVITAGDGEEAITRITQEHPDIVLADIGIVLVGTLSAALALGARTRDVLLPVLVLPFLIPIVIAGVTATCEETEVLRALGFLALYDLVFIALAWGTSEHLLGD